MTLLTFLVAGYSLLALPGPTNTLLATSGAGVGFSRSLPLLAAGAAWLAVGAVLGGRVRRSAQPHLVNRAGAFALVTVSGLVWLQSLGSALL